MPASLTLGCTVHGFETTVSSGTGGRITVQFPAGLGSIRLASGTGNGQINKIYQAVLSFSGTTAQTIDLTAVLEEFGRTVSFTKIKVFYLKPRSTTYADTLTVGNAASNIWSAMWSSSTNTELVYGSSPMLKTNLGAGWTVDGTHKSLKITPSATQTAEILLAGLS